VGRAQIDILSGTMTKILTAVENSQSQSTRSVITKGETDMYTLEAALLNQWREKSLSEKELLETVDLGKVVLRTAIGFGAFALLILCLNWAAEPTINQPQVATVDHMRLMPEIKE
jgi:hypothetical protein